LSAFSVRALLKAIHSEYVKTKHVVEGRKCPNKETLCCKIRLISERYAVDVKCRSDPDFNSFVLFDTLHGQKRYFLLVSAFPSIFRDLQADFETESEHRGRSHDFEMIDHEHLLFVDKYYMEGKIKIYLVKLDLPQMQLSVVDSRVLAGDFKGVIFNHNNRHIFAIQIFDVSNYFHIVCIKSSHLECSG
jgi:hypothetical protein